jgi:hypothetical protein
MTEIENAVAEPTRADRSVENLSRYFSGRVIQYHNSARDAFNKAAAFFIALLVALAIFVAIKPATPPGDWVQLTSEGVPKLLVLGVLVYGVRFFTKDYFVNRHLQVTYEHRMTILDTYRDLVFLIEDAVPRDRIAILLASAVVAEVQTGYLSGPDDTNPPTNALSVLDLLKK